ncbi:MAG TPA: hypothetical protein VN680_09230, partial [Burkholderiaceae bacterium]|nr:hypothetical protein [Burkholderiaceae bacterium]
ENEEINKFVGALTEKLFSEDLTNWEETASGRGAWRLVFKRAEGTLWILGVYDTHKPTYERWKVK